MYGSVRSIEVRWSLFFWWVVDNVCNMTATRQNDGITNCTQQHVAGVFSAHSFFPKVRLGTTKTCVEYSVAIIRL